MGNATSTQRADFLQRDERRFHEIVQQRHDRSTSPAMDQGGSARAARRRTPTNQPAPSERRHSGLYGAFRRQTTTNLTLSESSVGRGMETNQVIYEQEDRPLVNLEDLRMQDAPITHISATPLARRQSTMSRLGSRLLPDNVLRGLLSSGEETPAEGQALRHGTSGPTGPTRNVWERPIPTQNYNRLSWRESLRQRTLTAREARRQSLRGPFSPNDDTDQMLPDNSPIPDDGDRMDLPPPATARAGAGPATGRRRARLSRIRQSLSQPLHGMLAGSHDRSQSAQATRGAPQRPARVAFADESAHLLPPITGMDHRLDVDGPPHELDAVEPETRNILSSSRITQGMSTIRRFPHGLRSRSTRLIRRGEHPPLSQVLQLAAAAIAAQLSGHAQPTANGVRPLAGDAFDGSIQNFVQTLQDAASAQAGENIDLNAAEGELPPVNFMRVFQFPNDENGTPITSRGQARSVYNMDMDSLAGHGDGDRSVTLVLVGVRSMPHGQEGSGGDNGTIGPSLDTLLSLPFLPPTNVLRNGSSGALFRRSEGRSRTSSRRHSMTNFNFPAQYETQRHQRTRNLSHRASTEQASLTAPGTHTHTPHGFSESPPGPRPPPSTPADIRSANATPDRRPSSASAAHSPPAADPSEEREMRGDVRPDSPYQARQRRRSDSEFARRPELSSFASRRNGVVEPDNPPAGAGRSWLIYVVGTNVSSDHPAFTMPSLFTDNPSYEDMQMLSTLLGPAKPPVATPEEVSSAGGIFRLVQEDGGMMAQAVHPVDAPRMALASGDRCLICLCDYALDEEVRLLNKCRHVYHRECIDEWLTTGRNSCPMCRGQGVDEQARHSAASPDPATAASAIT